MQKERAGTDSTQNGGFAFPSSALLSGPSAAKLAQAAQHLPPTVTVGTTAEILAALLLCDRPAAEGAPTPVAEGYGGLRRAIEFLAQEAGLRRVSPDRGTGLPTGGTALSGTPAAPVDGLSFVGTQAGPSHHSLSELVETAGLRIAIETVSGDGLSGLSTKDGIFKAAERLETWLQTDSPLLPSILSQAGLLRGQTLDAMDAGDRMQRPLLERLGTFLQSLEHALRAASLKSPGPAELGLTLARFYAALGAPLVELAAEIPRNSETAAADSQDPAFEPPIGSQPSAPKPATPQEALAALRAHIARDVLAATNRDMALLSADMSRLLSYHQRGLRLLRKTRGFLTAVGLTGSSAQRRQPLGVLLESGRRSAAGISTSGRRALVDTLAMIGALDGPVLDRFAQAGERDGNQPLAALLSGLADGGDRRASEDPLAELDGATLGTIVTEARSAARLLRAMLFRETAAADALAARLQAYEAGRYSLVR